MTVRLTPKAAAAVKAGAKRNLRSRDKEASHAIEAYYGSIQDITKKSAHVPGPHPR
jgi:hypothetical protein